MKNLFFILIASFIAACNPRPDTIASSPESPVLAVANEPEKFMLAAEQYNKYLPLLEGKKVGMVTNVTAQIDGRHVVDILIEKGVSIKAIYGPEHGFRGDSEDGAKIEDGVDSKTGIPIFSLYGKNRKPTPEMMEGIEVMVFDIQDVGARFYTFISTMHYAMEAAAEANIPFIVLDRPNPNGNYAD
ncbi:MAG: DUF1343 domain-containing protein, partial [Cyclobacteriaceae bacterium]|nr:DUF1343 domain-containing protein [Cyclobacteriaceae bacterium]